MNNKNVKGLIEHAKLKKDGNDICIDKSIEKLKRKGLPINFSTVARESGISRTSLYADPKRRERIVGLRGLSKEKNTHKKKLSNEDGTFYEALQTKIKELRKEINELKAENNTIALQLVQLERLKDENQRLHNYIDRIKENSFQTKN